MATADPQASTSAAGAAEEKQTSPWPWLYKPAEWDQPEIKDAYDILFRDEGELDGLNFDDKYSTKVEKIFDPQTLKFSDIPEVIPVAKRNIEISFKPTELTLTLPEFLAAPSRLPSRDERGEKVNPIFAEEIRYATVAPTQPLPGCTMVMLSIWIKYKPGCKSKAQEDEEKMNVRYNVVTFPQNEDWLIHNLFIAIKEPQDALMFINAVSRLVYTFTLYVDSAIDSFGEQGSEKPVIKKHAYLRMRWEKEIGVVMREKQLNYPETRVSRIRPSLYGYLEITKCSVEQRDKIDMERIEAEPDSDSDDEDEMTRTRLETDAEPQGPPPKTATELTLTPQVLYVIVDEEQIGFYENPLCAQPLYDLRLYQNQTDQSIDMIYKCKKTGQLEIQRDKVAFIIRAAEQDLECFKKLDKLVQHREIKAKPKKIFTDVEQFLDYYEAMEMKLTNPEEIKELQRKLLEKLNEQNKTFAESLGMSKSKLPPGFPVPGTSTERPPTPPPPSRNWIRFVLNKSHMKEMPDPHLAEAWQDQIIPELNRLLASNIEPATLGFTDSNSGDEDLRNVIGEIREHLRKHEMKQAIAKLRALREMFGSDLLASLQGVDDFEILDRIFFLPG